MKKVLVVIDGQGGGFGRALIEKLRQQPLPEVEIRAVGTNALATSAMLKAGDPHRLVHQLAGADAAATGENAVIVNAGRADILAGPVGIVLANSMMGEFSPAMAAAVGESPAKRVLIPVSRCATYVAGVAEKPLAQYLEDAAALIRRLLEEE